MEDRQTLKQVAGVSAFLRPGLGFSVALGLRLVFRVRDWAKVGFNGPQLNVSVAVGWSIG